MKQRLGCSVKGDGGLWNAHGLRTDVKVFKVGGICGKLRCSDELAFSLHVIHQLSLFHFADAFHAFGHELREKSFLVGALDDVADVAEIFHHQQGFFGQEAQKGDFLADGRAELRNDLDSRTSVVRELTLYIERPKGVYFIPEEVDTERQFAAVRVDIDNASTQGKLAGFVDIIHFGESESSQRLRQFRGVDGLTDGYG